jgi:periplasmic divalent cation tolerance protein
MMEPVGTPPVCVEVVITAESAEWLADFTSALLEDRITACADVAPVRTTYRRDGKVVDTVRSRAHLHTRAALVTEILDRTEREHPDEVTSVVVLRLLDGNPDYLQWIVRETAATAHLVHTR